MFIIYLVGGAIRDKLLGLPVKELDWLVIGSDFDLMFKHGFHLVGKDFPVFLHPISKEEYALARKEKKVSVGYTGFKCDFSSFVSLKDDLLRRDLTVNAIALDEYGVLIDPLSGITHLNYRSLIHTSFAFSEDPLRILRLARFVTKYYKFKFFVAFDTYRLAKKIVLNGEIKHVVLERVLKEIFLVMEVKNVCLFFSFLYKFGALKYLFFDLYLMYKSSHKFQFNINIDFLLHLNNVFISIFDCTNNLNLKFSILFLNLRYTYFLCYKLLYKKNDGEKFKFYKSLFNLSKKNYKFIVFLSIFKLFFNRFFLMQSLNIYIILSKVNAYRDKVRFMNLLLVCDLDLKINFKINIFYEKYKVLDILNELEQFDLSFDKRSFYKTDVKTRLYEKKINSIKKYREFYKRLYF